MNFRGANFVRPPVTVIHDLGIQHRRKCAIGPGPLQAFCRKEAITLRRMSRDEGAPS